MDKKYILKLLKEHNAILVRKKKHEVWKFPNGKSISISISPSDHRAIKQIEKTIIKTSSL